MPGPATVQSPSCVEETPLVEDKLSSLLDSSTRLDATESVSDSELVLSVSLSSEDEVSSELLDSSSAVLSLEELSTSSSLSSVSP